MVLRLIFCLFFLFFGCADTERDSPNDPSSPNYVADVNPSSSSSLASSSSSAAVPSSSSVSLPSSSSSVGQLPSSSSAAVPSSSSVSLPSSSSSVGQLPSSSSAAVPSSSSVAPPPSSSSLFVGGSGCDIEGYRTVKIGEQTWMAENLNCEVSGSVCYGNNPANCSVCYGNNPANCDAYGRLYNWATAMIVCPSGWHLPNDADWDELMTAVGGSLNAGAKLKATSGWNSNGNGLDDYGFFALPGGYGSSDGFFFSVGDYGYWWSSAEDGSFNAYRWRMYYDYSSVYRTYDDKSILFSVRCVQD
ncbi:MAG: fibrobacter succinogenes major paralogous domain-containing protein [Fibromonadales bacterium]|nr:fibrobacter succinogenes major paralogous domain-containing protein [Fibromonadales bacterium]